MKYSTIFRQARLRGVLAMIVMLGVCLWAGMALGQQIDATHKYAWSENAGWLNFNPDQANVDVYPTHLEGHAWGENVGWVRLGTHTGGGTHTYLNTSRTNFGVNRSGNQLSGYAWGENIGWINFGPTGGGVSINPATGDFSGYAWGENIGWIKLAGTAGDSTAYKVKLADTAPSVTTQAVTSIGTTSATGNGNITSLGVPNPTAHGICWATTANPTIADSKTDEGAASSTGAFTSSMTGLTPGTTYHVRAFATNAGGTVYGEQVSFPTLNTYTLTYNAGANGSITGTTPQTVNHGASGTEVTAVPATGYSFVKWSDNVMTASRTDTNVTDDITVTAEFAPITYTVTYDANDATSGTAPANQTKTQGVDLTLASNTGNLARDGFTFAGWNTAADGTGTDYAEGATYTGNAAITLYAKWTDVSHYTLTVTNGTGSGQYTAGAMVNIQANAPDEGKVFDKWTGDTAHVANVNSASTTVTMPAGNVSVTAIYKDALGHSGSLAEAAYRHCATDNDPWYVSAAVANANRRLIFPYLPGATDWWAGYALINAHATRNIPQDALCLVGVNEDGRSFAKVLGRPLFTQNMVVNTVPDIDPDEPRWSNRLFMGVYKLPDATVDDLQGFAMMGDGIQAAGYFADNQEAKSSLSFDYTPGTPWWRGFALVNDHWTQTAYVRVLVYQADGGVVELKDRERIEIRPGRMLATTLRELAPQADPDQTARIRLFAETSAGDELEALRGFVFFGDGNQATGYLGR